MTMGDKRSEDKGAGWGRHGRWPSSGRCGGAGRCGGHASAKWAGFVRCAADAQTCITATCPVSLKLKARTRRLPGLELFCDESPSICVSSEALFRL